MKQVTHVEKRGKWARHTGDRVCIACSATSPHRTPMPPGWRDHLVDGAHVFTCSASCRLAKGLKA